jgi:hypothetical protein
MNIVKNIVGENKKSWDKNIKYAFVGIFTRRMFFSLMERTTLNQTLRVQKMRNLKRDRGFQKCRRDLRDRLAGGEKVETFEH